MSDLMKNINIRTSSIFILIAILAFSRLIPHPPNFTPLLGMAVFAGAMLDKKLLAFMVPLLAMFLSDLVLGFHSSISIIYFAIMLNVAIGFLLVSKFTYLKGLVALFSGAFIFFIVTNFAVWLGSSMYSQDINGLISCYIMALPFFQNTLLSTVMYGLGAFYLFDLFENKFIKSV
jgi:hypothetical protein